MRSCGTRITAACVMAGWVTRKLSTSLGKTLKPATLTSSLARPDSVTLPCSSIEARSPVANHVPAWGSVT